MRNVAIIGTAGRDKDRPMTLDLWRRMWDDASSRFVNDDFRLVSGGAAWADHLAVVMFLNGETKELSLHLPAPFHNQRFVGASGSAASAANYYHEQFSKAIGYNTRLQIAMAIELGAMVTEQPSDPGYEAMFVRNNLVAAEADYGCLAYTWGEGKEPADGGTKYTWDRCKGRRVHVPLSRFLED